MIDKYTYGPITGYNGEPCPVPVETLVRVLLTGSQWGFVLNAYDVNWPQVQCYRIATPVPVDVVGERVFFGDFSDSLWLTKFSDAITRVTLPTVNRKLVSCKCGMCKVEDV